MDTARGFSSLWGNKSTFEESISGQFLRTHSIRVTTNPNLLKSILQEQKYSNAVTLKTEGVLESREVIRVEM